MRFFLCLIIILLFSACASDSSEQVFQEYLTDGSLSSESSVTQENSTQPQDYTSSSDSQPYKMSITAYTNFELKNGGFEPQFVVTLTKDIVLENEGYNLTAVFPDGNWTKLGWVFIYEIREYDKYDNPLYYYENPEKSKGYISHEMTTCGSYKCMRIKCREYLDIKDDNSEIYSYRYFVSVNESEILSLTFFAPNDLESTLKTQESFIATIER